MSGTIQISPSFSVRVSVRVLAVVENMQLQKNEYTKHQHLHLITDIIHQGTKIRYGVILSLDLPFLRPCIYTSIHLALLVYFGIDTFPFPSFVSPSVENIQFNWLNHRTT